MQSAFLDTINALTMVTAVKLHDPRCDEYRPAQLQVAADWIATLLQVSAYLALRWPLFIVLRTNLVTKQWYQARFSVLAEIKVLLPLVVESAHSFVGLQYEHACVHWSVATVRSQHCYNSASLLWWIVLTMSALSKTTRAMSVQARSNLWCWWVHGAQGLAWVGAMLWSRASAHLGVQSQWGPRTGRALWQCAWECFISTQEHVYSRGWSDRRCKAARSQVRRCQPARR